ncbi:MAG: hypothetical protein WD850_02690 [Candidatus Spechtbacterales bacterium]
MSVRIAWGMMLLFVLFVSAACGGGADARSSTAEEAVREALRQEAEVVASRNGMGTKTDPMPVERFAGLSYGWQTKVMEVGTGFLSCAAPRDGAWYRVQIVVGLAEDAGAKNGHLDKGRYHLLLGDGSLISNKEIWDQCPNRKPQGGVVLPGTEYRDYLVFILPGSSAHPQLLVYAGAESAVYFALPSLATQGANALVSAREELEHPGSSLPPLEQVTFYAERASQALYEGQEDALSEYLKLSLGAVARFGCQTPDQRKGTFLPPEIVDAAASRGLLGPFQTHKTTSPTGKLVVVYRGDCS